MPFVYQPFLGVQRACFARGDATVAGCETMIKRKDAAMVLFDNFWSMSESICTGPEILDPTFTSSAYDSTIIVGSFLEVCSHGACLPFQAIEGSLSWYNNSYK